MLTPANLPDDMDALKAMLSASLAVIADRDAVIERKEDRIIRLEKLLADFKRALFGHRSEKSDPEQFELALEDIGRQLPQSTPKMRRSIRPNPTQPRLVMPTVGLCPNTCRALRR